MALTDRFNKFAGKEIMVAETPYKQKILGQMFEGVHARLEENDPTIAALEAEAKQAGLYLRIWMPNSMGTCDVQTSRLNVHIEKEDDGKYRIQPGFHLG